MTLITKRFRIVLLFLAAAVVTGFLMEILLSLKTGWQFGHTQRGHLVGWLGFATLLTVFGYSIKKRSKRKAGWPKGWFRAHQTAGIVGPLLILVHAGPHFHALVPFFALLSMGIVAVSGIVGVVVHRKAISLLNATRKKLLSQGLSSDDVDEHLYELASDEEIFRVWQLIHVPMVFVFMALVIIHIGGAIYFGGL